MNAIDIKELKKVYSNNFTALKGISFAIKKGDFFALLGSNGAGKTTTINILSGLLPKTSGRVECFGISQEKNPEEVKKLIGLMPQEFNFNPFEPVEEIIMNQAGYYGIHKSVAKVKTEELLKKMQLWDKRKDMAKSLSGGMKRRLMLARALIHEPKILILDEPTAGVDVEIRRSLWVFLEELNKEGITIILTTHYLEEAEKLCKNIAIIDKGEVLVNTTMNNLLSQVEKIALVLELKNTLADNIKLPSNYTLVNQNKLKVILGKEESVNDVILELSKNNIIVKNIINDENKLENLFVNLTGGK